LSFGGYFKSLIYPNLPLLQFIRTNGEYRVFSIFSFIVVSSFSLDKILKNGKSAHLNKILVIFAIACLIGPCLFLLTHQIGNLFQAQMGNSQGPMIDKIKWWLDHWTFNERLFINSIVLIILLAIYFLGRIKIHLRILVPLIISLDLLVFCWMQLPISGVQKKSAASINAYFDKLPKGIPTPSLQAIGDNLPPNHEIEKVIGCWSYYSKEPGAPTACDYPTELRTTREYFQSGFTAQANQHPFLFVQNHEAGEISLKYFAPTEILVEAKLRTGDSLILLQNDYLHWKLLINGKSSEINRKWFSFMSCRLNKGNSIVRFYFQNRNLLVVFIVSISSLALLIYLAIRENKRIEMTLPSNQVDSD